MDYILPSDDTMRKMANEYAKIKRIGVPQRISSFSNDMPKTMPMKRLAKYLEETKKQDVLYNEDNIEKMAYEYEKALSKGINRKQNDCYYIDDGEYSNCYQYDFLDSGKVAKTQQKNQYYYDSDNMNGRLSNGNYYYGSGGQGGYGYGTGGQNDYNYGFGGQNSNNYNYGIAGQNNNQNDYNYTLNGRQGNHNYSYGSYGGMSNDDFDGQVKFDSGSNGQQNNANYQDDGNFQYSGNQNGGNYKYGGYQKNNGYQYGANQGSGYQYGNYQNFGGYKYGQNGMNNNSIPAEVIYQPSNNNGNNFVIDDGRNVTSGNGQNNFVIDNGNMMPDNQNFGSNGFGQNDANNRLRRGPNNFSIPQTDVIFQPSNGNGTGSGTNGNGSANNDFNFSNGNFVGNGTGQNDMTNNPYNSFQNQNVPNNPYRQPQKKAKSDNEVPQVELIAPKDSPELIKLEPNLDENNKREQMFRQFAPQLFNSRLFNLALAVFFLTSF